MFSDGCARTAILDRVREIMVSRRSKLRTIFSANGIISLVLVTARRLSFRCSAMSSSRGILPCCLLLSVSSAHVESHMQRPNHGSRNKCSGSTLKTFWINNATLLECEKHCSAQCWINAGGTGVANLATTQFALSGMKASNKRMQH